MPIRLKLFKRTISQFRSEEIIYAVAGICEVHVIIHTPKGKSTADPIDIKSSTEVVIYAQWKSKDASRRLNNNNALAFSPSTHIMVESKNTGLLQLYAQHSHFTLVTYQPIMNGIFSRYF